MRHQSVLLAILLEFLLPSEFPGLLWLSFFLSHDICKSEHVSRDLLKFRVAPNRLEQKVLNVAFSALIILFFPFILIIELDRKKLLFIVLVVQGSLNWLIVIHAKTSCVLVLTESSSVLLSKAGILLLSLSAKGRIISTKRAKAGSLLWLLLAKAESLLLHASAGLAKGTCSVSVWLAKGRRL